MKDFNPDVYIISFFVKEDEGKNFFLRLVHHFINYDAFDAFELTFGNKENTPLTLEELEEIAYWFGLTGAIETAAKLESIANMKRNYKKIVVLFREN